MSLDLSLVLGSRYNLCDLIAWGIFAWHQRICFRLKTIKCRRLLFNWLEGVWRATSKVWFWKGGGGEEGRRMLRICQNPHKRWMRENLGIWSTLIWLGGVMYTLHRIVKEQLSPAVQRAEITLKLCFSNCNMRKYFWGPDNLLLAREWEHPWSKTGLKLLYRGFSRRSWASRQNFT